MPKLSEVTKALKKAGYVKLDDNAIFGPYVANSYYKYNGDLYINGKNIGFSMSSAKNAKIFGRYHTSATNVKGQSFETYTNWPELFFPRLFRYLSKEITEEQIINEICTQP